MKKTFQYFAGIDWAADSYQICVVDENGQVLGEKQFEHSGDGIRQCIEWLLESGGGNGSSLAAAIEVPHGAMVESLIENNLAVFAINPKQMDRFRDRHTVAGAKDDALDAFVIADSLRTDQTCFHRLEIDEPAVLRPREWSRMDQDLQTESNRGIGVNLTIADFTAIWIRPLRLGCRPAVERISVSPDGRHPETIAQGSC